MQTFDVIALRIHCIARKDLALSANLLRGQFGKALRGLDREAYERWFAPRSIEGPSGLRDAPRAFVLRVLDERVPRRGRFEFGFNLFDLRGADLAIQALSQFLDVESVTGRQTLHLSLAATRDVSRVRVSFITPTELKGSDRPEFAILFARLRDRISTLRALYQGGPLEIDFKAMAARAARVEMTSCEIRHADAERVSRSTGQRHSLGGFVGLAEYQGELGEFLPYLEIGRYTGVGRQTVWGKGEIHAVVA